VAYETLVGRLPFDSVSKDEWRASVLAGRFAPLDASLKDPPTAWEAFFADCFAKDRAKRPQSAAELFRRLEKALTHA
jgi:hypothetical protein